MPRCGVYCVWEQLHYEPQQDTSNPIPIIMSFVSLYFLLHCVRWYCISNCYDVHKEDTLLYLYSSSMEPDLMFACTDRIMFWVIMLDVKNVMLYFTSAAAVR
jgi:hypothetical protein